MLCFAALRRLPAALPVLLLTACSQPAPPAAGGPPPSSLGSIERHFDRQWALSKHWDDGLAEVATYAAEREVYKKKRTYELTIITVKEDFNRAFDVKTDDYQRPDLFAVMKVNEFCQIPTDNYPYHYLTSLFFRREDPVQLHKLTSSSQEWCGNTFKALTDSATAYQYSYNSYWDGQGTGRRSLPRDIVLEDALPYTLRSLRFNDQPLFEVNVLETQQTSKAAEPKLYRAGVRVARAADAEAPRPSWRVTVELERGKANVYWFDQRYPHLLLRHTAWDGRTLLLKNERRYAYWQH
ncbi:hypothetical protein EJV47_05105 [Hymenobacter gummosus]|uniref:DUF3108 domain-containing protein n=1 Tax=Hymenobacter gummosus TaxID=1776032 RepID=A0A3S0HBM7_9BACT|nr:hypothetical protein [Hymenobacter gummosus]RTQ52394.1 hypothetical protein EJV47_05105 [Hymenobacter gummosus]